MGNPLFPRKEMSVHVCEELLRMFARSPKRNICHLPSSFFGRELFLAFVSIFYVNSFYIEFVPSQSFSASHRKKYFVSLALSSPLEFLNCFLKFTNEKYKFSHLLFPFWP